MSELLSPRAEALATSVAGSAAPQVADRLVVAADGGNSKTDLILATAAGQVLAQTRGGGTRAPDDGVDVTAAMLAALVDRARQQAGLRSGAVIDVAVFYCANVDLPEQGRELCDALAGLNVARRIVVDNDMMAALQAGTPDGCGVAVVAGAGINAVAVGPDGRREGYLALGESTGDKGGGGWIATQGQMAAIRAWDGRGPATVLERLVPEHFHLPDPEAVGVALSLGGLTSGDLLPVCPVVFAAAEAGDCEAQRIIVEHAGEVAIMAAAAARRLGLDDQPVPVILGGSVLSHGGPFQRAAVTRALARELPKAEPVFLDAAPVAGSLNEAMRLARIP